MRQAVSRVPMRGSGRRAIEVGQEVTTRPASLPAPVGGWDAVSALADMEPDRAIVLDNWFPYPDSVGVRRGYASWGTGLGSGVVDSLMPYQGAATSSDKLFAVANSIIYDVSASGAASATSVTGLANNRWQFTNFTTSGGKYLWACNGADTPKHWDGSNWATPSITGITSTDIIHVNAHEHRLWFVLKDSTKAAYLPVQSIAGAASTFELGSLFTKGGYLNAMATWTRDGGFGDDDLAAFISSRGQVAIYGGTDPSSANTWSLIGVFDLGAPLSRRCFVKVGGDLALVNVDGVLPFGQALQTDRGAAPRIAITKNINNAMTLAARSYSANFGWELTAYAKGNMAILNVPVAEGVTQHQYVMNTLTGAWCRFTGWGANCFAVYKDRLFFGGNAGVVYEADKGGKDGSADIQAIGQGAYNYFKAKGQLKNFGFARAAVTADSSGQRPAIGMSTDFRDNATLGTPATSTTTSALYDTAIYDTDVYATESRSVLDWSSIANQGHCGSVHFRASTNATGEVTVRVNGFDVIYKLGGML